MKLTANNINEIKVALATFLYFSYRTGFISLKAVGCHNYTSDCGWGCMIRCSQMIFSKAFIEKKIFDLLYQGENIDNNLMKKVRKEALCLFNDNYLSVEEVRNHPDYQYFWELLEEIKKENPEYNSIKKIIPPYSIHILCKLGHCEGEFTSDMNMINVFSSIISDISDSFNIINFCVGIIDIGKLFKSLCDEVKELNNDNKYDIINYNGKHYTMKKSGIIFISFRLGLDFLDPEYFEIIPLIFSKFRNNFGIIGGIKKRAYYFIGMQGNDKLIFVDPHYTQETKDNSEQYYETYFTENLYLLNIKEMRNQFSLGIGVFNNQQFNQFLEDAKWFSENFNNFIRFE